MFLTIMQHVEKMNENIRNNYIQERMKNTTHCDWHAAKTARSTADNWIIVAQCNDD